MKSLSVYPQPTIYPNTMPKTFFILAGEASGDKHAARLIKQLKAQSPGARCVGMGGRAMQNAGFEAFKDLDGMQVVGFWEVAKKYGFFKKVFYDLLDTVKQTKPDALICIDYPGFNLRFAEEVKKLGIPVLYYIVPQVWAWKAARAKKMTAFVDRAFCVFEFEIPFFQKYGLKTEFVGHPLVDVPEPVISQDSYACPTQQAQWAFNPSSRPPAKPVIQPLDFARGLFAPSRDAIKTVSFLPGSRGGEIRQHLGPMRGGFERAQTNHPATRGLWSLPDETDGDVRRVTITPAANETLNVDEARAQLSSLNVSHSLLLPSVSDFSVVKSGTSTLEAGLGGNPMCVIYRGSPISFLIARMLVNIPVFSLVNIVLGRYAVPELAQSEVNPARLAEEIRRGLFDEQYRETQRAALAEIPAKLGGTGASERAARGMLNFLDGK